MKQRIETLKKLWMISINKEHWFKYKQQNKKKILNSIMKINLLYD